MRLSTATWGASAARPAMHSTDGETATALSGIVGRDIYNPSRCSRQLEQRQTLTLTKALLRTKKSNMSPPAAYSIAMPRYRRVRNTSRNCSQQCEKFVGVQHYVQGCSAGACCRQWQAS